MIELAWGLEMRKQRFVWVVRAPAEESGDKAYLKGRSGDEIMTNLDWVSQVDILSTLYWSVYISLWMEFNTGEYFEGYPYNCISTLCRAKDRMLRCLRGIWHGSRIGGFAIKQSGGKGGDTK
ncbi:udp-glycosyltransferase 72e1 [Quercus suber]|uniref:Udp-glycosyltransferase 72e1 n=1 Tax=Quercus suber TaxID=58331 RepID=A0AAW0M0N8_QUESU